MYLRPHRYICILVDYLGIQVISVVASVGLRTFTSVYCNCNFSGIPSATTRILTYVVPYIMRSDCSNLSLVNRVNAPALWLILLSYVIQYQIIINKY
jgi:hypothetical protein